MSRGFVKEEDQEEAPFIPPRAALPAGTINYVTPTGIKLLMKEREEFEGQLLNLNISNEKEKRHARAVITGKLNLVNERITTARVIKVTEQPAGEIRFGAKIELKKVAGSNKQEFLSFQIVGVDEADIKNKKIAFVAPIAKALSGKRVGEEAEVLMAGKIQKLEILSISY